ncbi:hypothetical protein GJ654_05525 [Rhodoblastus acidophilus]|uniref:Leucyl/phenylalanyl-tRNA--protein transferase n=1 Tax=Rhodoblastus acidophilus TaxID=1074 RepID=A0A6N8DIX6_RHOAC|nr:hypothetical protein [Rhodoblastus acidophilus]MCW2273464.1 Leu/Phe-tRNA-protein transferase [Rhodoblastus acidophilus]MTV30450.1 hypothetical protein [Rhodoblastus acidophilus]
MSNVRLQEIALLPLDQRAAHIARLFAEGGEPPAPRAPAKRGRVERLTRALAEWAHPSRLPLAVTALAVLAGKTLFGAEPRGRAPQRADGFCGLTPIPDAEAALDLYAQGLYFEAVPGLASLWSPPRRAIVRALRLSGCADPREGEVRLDCDFERLLDLCDAQGASAGRRPPGRTHLSELFGRGLAHALEMRDGEETRAAIIGVAVGGVFTVECFFAANREAFASAVAELGRRLEDLHFLAMDFRAPSPHLDGLPIESMEQQDFVALLAEPGGARPGRWRAGDSARSAQQAA